MALIKVTQALFKSLIVITLSPETLLMISPHNLDTPRPRLARPRLAGLSSDWGRGHFSLSLVKMVPVGHMTFGPASARSELWA